MVSGSNRPGLNCAADAVGAKPSPLGGGSLCLSPAACRFAAGAGVWLGVPAVLLEVVNKPLEKVVYKIREYLLVDLLESGGHVRLGVGAVERYLVLYSPTSPRLHAVALRPGLERLNRYIVGFGAKLNPLTIVGIRPGNP